MTISHALAGLESGHDDKETGTGSALARGNLAASAGCHAPDAGDSADPACAEEEIEVTPEMIKAGAEVLYSYSYRSDSVMGCVRDIFSAMTLVARANAVGYRYGETASSNPRGAA